MCLTCHRAHASGWDYMARWNLKSKMLLHDGEFAGTDNKAPASVAQGRTLQSPGRPILIVLLLFLAPFRRGYASSATIRIDSISPDTYATSSP